MYNITGIKFFKNHLSSNVGNEMGLLGFISLPALGKISRSCRRAKGNLEIRHKYFCLGMRQGESYERDAS